MTVLDVSIVNVALPSIGRSLHFSATGIQWVVTAYAITFGGFLLLGGRAADLLGRRRMFMAGLVLFSAASLVCGLATSTGMIVAVALLLFFVAWERRVPDPLMPLQVFRIRMVAGANAAALLLGAVVFSNFLILTLYVQDVLHYTALRTGITFLATAGTVVLVA